MKDESMQWLQYAEENLESARVLRSNNLHNPCLQNVQQCVEKSLKAVIIERSLKLKILRNFVLDIGVQIDLSDEDCEFLDSIYLPSRYPLGSALPDFVPDDDLCNTGLKIADRVISNVKAILGK